ncbi:MAG: sigma-54-dependent transcriptional regulator [Candidatus Puniceispirillales bacterium]
MKPEILVVDDEPDIRSMIRLILEDEGFDVREAENAETARDELTSHPPALIILDIWMRQSDMDGLELQKWVRRYYPHVPVLMISGHGNIETAVQAMKDGAFDFLEKPFKSAQLILLCQRALANAARDAEHDELKRRYDISLDQIGSSPAIHGIRQTVDKVAQSNSRIFITGPSGSGKELLARNIHDKSNRTNGRFVMVNCAALSSQRSLIELFGSEANNDGKRVVGLFEQAHGGTLFFDEISDLSLDTQARLVRTLQDQRFKRLGGNTDVQVDVRVISATSQDIKAKVAEEQFREELYYRLNVVPIAIPPLSRRREDIAELALYFLKKRMADEGDRQLSFTPDCLAALESYSWPGNITQLRNMIDWLVIMADRSKHHITREDLPVEITGLGQSENTDNKNMASAIAMPLKEAREQFEIEYLMSQLSRFNGNISKTAAFIGMERSALHRKLKNLGIQVEAADQMEEPS